MRNERKKEKINIKYKDQKEDEIDEFEQNDSDGIDFLLKMKKKRRKGKEDDVKEEEEEEEEQDEVQRINYITIRI